MKRALFDTVKVRPHAIADAIDREAYLSLVLGIVCSAATATPSVTFKLQHAATSDGSFVDVPDELAIITKQPISLAKNGVYQLNVDLLGCKRFVKVVPTIEGTATLAYALALGDNPTQPSE